MNNLRIYGNLPFNVVLIHGGPGAAGEMAPVARELLQRGISSLEPLQTKDSIQGQLDELKEILESKGKLPIILIGYSWGAMLSFIFTANNPKLVKKLILVSSGLFEDKYVDQIMKTRFSHLSIKDAERLNKLFSVLDDPLQSNKDDIFSQIGKLIEKSDNYNPVERFESDEDKIIGDPNIYEKVWPQAQALRTSGKFLAYGKQIKCPVVAIHGDYDPHPVKGIQDPLLSVLGDFKFILLKNCGHNPWKEKEVSNQFYKILESEIRNI